MLYEVLEHLLVQVVMYASLIIEFIGVIVLIFELARCLKHFIKRENTSMIILGEGIADALTILMGAEILNSIILDEIREFVPLAICVALRTVMAVLTHWETENKRKECHLD